jgi:hypothetical protein
VSQRDPVEAITMNSIAICEESKPSTRRFGIQSILLQTHPSFKSNHQLVCMKSAQRATEFVVYGDPR